MKKLFLLTALGSASMLSATAQSAAGVAKSSETISISARGVESTVPTTPVVLEPSAKTTVGGSRWYNYVDHLALIGAPVEDSPYPYMWDKFNAMAIYGAAGGGIEVDTISFGTYGLVFDPAFSSSVTGKPLGGFNDPSGYPGADIAVTRANTYQIDSVRVYGVYGRDNNRTTTVDTLRVALVYGNGTTGSDLGGYYFSGMTASYGVDTVRYHQPFHDTTGKNTLRGASLKIVDILLTKTDTGGGGYAAAVPAFTVPAGNVVAVSVTFKSGDTYIPYVDTIFFGSARAANPFGRGMFRPSLFEQSAGAFPGYNAGYSNFGLAKYYPSGYTGTWKGFYLPNYAYTSPDFSAEFANIDLKVTCTSCSTIAEYNSTTSIMEQSLLMNVNAYPNPATSELTIPFTVKETANVTVSISNLLGQVISTQEIGKVNGGQQATAVFNTSNLTSGIYTYTVEANGQRVSNRFSVAN